MENSKKTKKRISLTNQIIAAMVLGIIAGLIGGKAIAPVEVVGNIFLRLIQMSVIVLIMGAVIEAVGRLEVSELGNLGVKILILFGVSTIIAAAIGCIFGMVLQPGRGVLIETDLNAAAFAAKEMSLQDMLLSFAPNNIVNAMTEGNMIQVIVFAILFGIGTSIMKGKKGSSRILDLLEEVNGILIEMVSKIMIFAPIGIGALIAATVGKSGVGILLPLIKFLLILAVGTFLHLAFCVAVTAAYCKTGFFNLSRKIANMTVVAFTTTSSAVTLPVKMKDSEEKLGVSKRISDLVNPLGMSLNSNGLAMFLSLAVVTIAQIYGQEVTIEMLLKIVVLASLACLGTVVVPGGGIVALTIVVPSLGLPLGGIAIMAGIDWFSGMFRTILNVDVDALAAMMIAKSAGELDDNILNNHTGG
ncbi:dicarboxylate/amino acid:cation symporter [Faecalicatena contorta]|uniref:Na+/H+-dicarboxylate symporter n=1 Tax=Faecalicatena contorta TaxID=39482 RepID=A0A315ZU80_9FIRM|nr:dicarboxylate/amino acid:cation symporter [Faecalicatena contorta]PWJ48763.1 Na+/H+-dicarboxylate symporter [Faecalicatena contorta]SUQ15186.1 Na+/H+-dicarboxylate symporter [Faecalicatena contorta]